MKKHKILIFIAIALGILNIVNYLGDNDNYNIFDSKKYTLDSFAISKLKEQEFHELRIIKKMDRKNLYRKGYDTDKIKEIVEYLNKFELKVQDELPPMGEQDAYRIHLKSKSTYEDVAITLWNEKCITISPGNIIKEENKERKITRLIQNNTRETFTVVDKEIDLKYIEEIFNSLEEEKR
ncbi:hypothetical protein [Brassicibacter mesophilus]|uniref:hypothetical protein n=1 Tax=Brassicibacter mesophilus TaxID=745119 RepID=UPI003D24E1D3